MRILVVEDEHKIANSIKRGLEQENYVVDIAYDGEKGYDLASSEEFDLIILDRMLPGMDGVEICKKLRASAIHTPILLLTARGQLEDKVEGLDAGADDYLPKPFAFAELLARIRALVRRPKVTVSAQLKAGSLTLNTKTFEVKLKGKPITLSNKEYLLLEYLMRHKDSIVTKDQIINNVWSYEANVLPNSVEVYIKHLRNKLRNPKLIQTLRGFGYKISA
ncbi:MAG: response regulator transcription factor [Candidatus Levyibacteriota bacterium]